MDTLSVDRMSGTLSVSLTVDDLALLASAINEALVAVDDWEFDTRLGATPDDARALSDSLRELIHAATPPQT